MAGAGAPRSAKLTITFVISMLGCLLLLYIYSRPLDSAVADLDDEAH